MDKDKVLGMVTLMSGVEYGVYLHKDWQKFGEERFLQCWAANTKRPMLFNRDGILMVRQANKSEFDRWVHQQEQLEQLQQQRIAETLKAEKTLETL